MATGYLGRPELTCEKFVPHPFRPETGKRLYATGDRGRFLPDGTLLCLGRTDHQVKLRGFRIELGEIESILGRHPAISQALVMAKDDGARRKAADRLLPPQKGNRRDRSGTPTLSRAGTSRPHDPVGRGRTFRVPPDAERQDRPRALARSWKTARPELETDLVAPRTPLEERLAQLWQELLGVERVGIRDNFFSLGGHSLLAVQMTARLRQSLGAEVSPARLFENPCIESFALCVLESLLQSDDAGAEDLCSKPLEPPNGMETALNGDRFQPA